MSWRDRSAHGYHAHRHMLYSFVAGSEAAMNLAALQVGSCLVSLRRNGHGKGLRRLPGALCRKVPLYAT
jgi:hypothetical protein